MMLVMIAEAEAILNGSGWAGAGLLGLVMGWLLLKHLPDKDKQISGLIDTFLKEVKEARAEAAEILSKERAMRHEERNQSHIDNLKMATLLTENTGHTQVLAQEVRALARLVSDFANKIENKDRPNEPRHV